MLYQRFFQYLAGLAIAFTIPTAFAAKIEFEEEEVPPWVEQAFELPPFPEERNLIPFKVGSISDRQYFVDGSSLTVGSDGVIRYVLLVVSSAGARNLSFEGMRCSTAERRSYAFGRPDKTWSFAKSDKWVRVQGSTNNHFVELFSSYLCRTGAEAPANGDDLRRAFRSSAGRW